MKFHSPLGVVETKHLKMTKTIRAPSDVTLHQQLHWKLLLLPWGEFVIIAQ